MTYTKQGDRVFLEMSQEQYLLLLYMIGFATGSLDITNREDRKRFRRWIEFVNELNTGSDPNFTPYEIPEAPEAHNNG